MYFLCAVNMQLGVALGFLLPPILVKDGTIEEIGNGLSLMFYIVAGLCTAVLILVVIGMYCIYQMQKGRRRGIQNV